MPKRYHLPVRYYYRRWFSTLDQEIALLRDLVGRGERAIDVGANLGVYTYALWRLCRWVDAFEPVPDHAATIRAFGAPEIAVHQAALSSAGGFRKLYFARDRGMVDLGRGSLSPPEHRSDQIEVPVRTMDDFGFTDVSFIKVDVEGHELDVLKGAAQTIERCRPNLFVEIEQRHLSFPMQTVFDHVVGLGYRGFFVHGTGLRPLSEFSYERHQRPYLDDVYSRDYINNFVFVT